MKSEFEEKDFEEPLYNELRFGSHRIATPGQVFEGRFGIDAALEAEHPLFWDLFGFYNVPRGVVLNDFKWGYVWRRYGKTRLLPTFKVNLLIQAKRPDVLSRASSELKALGINSKHWRFEITAHQQEILERITRTLRRRALVIYASPAFDEFESLYDYTEAQTVVENTSFVKVERLVEHTKWIYNCAGTTGVAHSEPEEVDDVPFYSMIDQLREYESGDDNHSENLAVLHRAALESCNEVEQYNPIAKYFLRLHGRLSRIGELYELAETKDYVAFNLFCNVTKLRWLVV